MHMRNLELTTCFERELRANLVYRQFTRVGIENFPFPEFRTFGIYQPSALPSGSFPHRCTHIPSRFGGPIAF